MEKINLPLKIVLTGPESSGKTTLAQRLAQVLKTKMVPEFSRVYLQYLGRAYEYNDFKTILLGQKNWEHWCQQNGKAPVLVCDTDWTVIRIWEQFQYKTFKVTEHEVLTPHTHYFLCFPDIPWEPDVLRENPADRDTLFGMYLELLTALNAEFTILTGGEQKRLETAYAIIQKLYGPLWSSLGC